MDSRKVPGPVLWLDRFGPADSEEIKALARRLARREGITVRGLLAAVDRALSGAAYGLGGRRGRERDIAWDRREAFRDARHDDPAGAELFAGVVIATEAARKP